MNRAALRLPFATRAEAEQAAASLAPDNDGHADVRVEGSVLVVVAAADSPLGLLRTLEDILECLRASTL